MYEEIHVIQSPRLGQLEVAPERVIEFPNGLPGFEDLRKFSLYHPEGEEPKYFLLQSMEQSDVVFTVVDPMRLGFTYEISLSDEESASIDLTDPLDAAVVVMLLKDSGVSATAAVKANLKAPLVINLRSRLGLQHVFSRLDYQVTLKSGN
ncbi:MAG: flagellar assembly protein FliW [Rhodocyclaceae bacterium]|nr:flagellar assembly protein FliW [Rhodocyclaceae bacterium]